MSSSYTQQSRRLTPIIHNLRDSRDYQSSRDSSRGSYTSYDSSDSRSSSVGYSGRSSMGGHSNGSSGGSEQTKYRVPDNASKYITASSRGNVDTIHHKTGRYDAAEPRSSDAKSTQYYSSSSKKYRDSKRS